MHRERRCGGRKERTNENREGYIYAKWLLLHVRYERWRPITAAMQRALGPVHDQSLLQQDLNSDKVMVLMRRKSEREKTSEGGAFYFVGGGVGCFVLCLRVLFLRNFVLFGGETTGCPRQQ